MTEEKKQVCQNCKRHENKPSRCLLKDKFIGRKDSCKEFKFK